MKSAVIVLTPPRIRHKDGSQERCYSRIKPAVEHAFALDCPLVICGDGTEDRSDLAAYTAYAEEHGVFPIPAWNGGNANTRGDIRAAVRQLKSHTELEDVEQLYLVTCWYHVPRAMVALHLELQAEEIRERFSLWPVAVWRNFAEGTWRLLNLRKGELRGTWDYLRENEHTSRMDSRVSLLRH